MTAPDKDPRRLDVSEDTVNRLYFAAKNLAIECAMRRIADFLAARGFPGAVARWCENSWNASIDLSVPLKGRKAPDERTIWLDRESLPRDLRPYGVSDLDHRVRDIPAWGSANTRAAADLNGVIASPEGQAAIRDAVAACNYPFPYGFHSTV